MSDASASELSPEMQVLTTCARSKLSSERAQQLDHLLDGSLDWAAVVISAARHGVSALLVHHLRQQGWMSRVDEAQRTALERAHAASRVLAMRQRAEALRVVGVLAEAGIDVALLKGLALREWVYPHPELRVSGDIDVLVRKHDATRARNLLVARGFSVLECHTRRADRWEIHMPPMQSPSGQVQLELHWNIIYPPATVDPADLWAKAEDREIDGLTVWGLAPVHQVLHLCSHAAVNRYGTGLRHLVDILEAVHRYRDRIGGEDLLRWARRWNVRRRAFLTLLTARDLLGGDQLDPLVEALRPRWCPPGVMAEARRTVVELDSGEEARPMSPLVALTSRAGWARLLPRLSPRRFADTRGVSPHSPRVVWMMLCHMCHAGWRFARALIKDRHLHAGASMEWWLKS